MILRRMGNKTKIASEIQKYFPEHKTYLEPFFGAGGMFFNKSKAKYNIVNDADSDVFNLFQVISNKKDEFEKAFYSMPIHQDLLRFWRENKEEEDIKKALRFLFLSNLTYLGAGQTLTISGYNNSKQIMYDLINKTNEIIFDVQFTNVDFRDFFKLISFDDRGNGGTQRAFIYCDPPYLGTNDNYSQSFKESDSIDLFDCLEESKCKWAMSEFNHPFIIEQAEKRGLNVITIGERQNLKNRRTEILVTNYKKPMSLFDGM
jgi:DNA adenine methylase